MSETRPETRTLSFQEIEDLALKALVAAGTSEENARPLARATAETEADGIASHGLAYVPIYCEHVRCGKVDGRARPLLGRPRPGLLRVDAASGFAHPAIELGLSELIPATREQGVAGLAITNSYNCGVLGCHTRRLAEAGLVGLGFTNAPASIAPVGGARPVVGTNPISLAVPGAEGGVALLIDQSASTVAKSEVMKHAREGRPIPPGWALDAEGRPTTDPELALKGSMAPAGGYKGVGLALIVEVMAAALTGASLGIHASPFSGPRGGPPGTGQFFIAIDPQASAGEAFARRIADLVAAIRDQEGARVPGDGRRRARARAAGEGIPVSLATLERIAAVTA
ncbi:MAG: Ldh family oxidoreductase [Alphaproteobacteria bacterium]|nr:MAG: Ldh family oxidoreductase [Alphaproteobacteria bacterium]